MPTRFETDTAVEAITAGHYRARLDRGWWIHRGPNGGYLAAIVLRAITSEAADAARAPRSLTIHYTRPPAEGALDLEVITERAGRTLSTLTARATQDGKLIALALVALATDQPSTSTFSGAVMPSVPPPEQVEAVPGGPNEIAMRARYEQRWVIGEPPPRDGMSTDAEAPAEVGGWIRLANEGGAQNVDHHVVVALTDAWMPAVFTKLARRGAVPTVDLTVHFREPPPMRPEWCLVRFRTRHVSHGYLEEDGDVWSADGRLLAQSRQLGLELPLA
jgi:acyl-CoA thioesterase